MQGFTDIIGSLVHIPSLEIPRVGLVYQSGDPGKLIFCWAQHFQDDIRNFEYRFEASPACSTPSP